MAGVVIRKLQRNGMAHSLRLEFSKKFKDVPTLGRESARALGVLRIITKEMAVVFEVGTTTGSVRHNRIHLSTLEDVNGTSSQIEGRSLLASMNQQGAATRLLGRSDDLASLGC